MRSNAAMVGTELAPASRALAAVVADYTVALLELGLGNYEAALKSALNVYEDDSPWVGTQVLPDLIEAAVRTGERGVAASGLARLSERTVASGTELALGLLACSRALLAADDDAGRLYEQATEHLQRCRTATALARAPSRLPASPGHAMAGPAGSRESAAMARASWVREVTPAFRNTFRRW